MAGTMKFYVQHVKAVLTISKSGMIGTKSSLSTNNLVIFGCLTFDEENRVGKVAPVNLICCKVSYTCSQSQSQLW